MKRTWLAFSAVCLMLLLLPSSAFPICRAVLVEHVCPKDDTKACWGDRTVDFMSHGYLKVKYGDKALLNNEGRTERVTDLLIYDDTNSYFPVEACFRDGQKFTLNYSAPMTDPTGINIPPITEQYVDVYDPDHIGAGLTVLAETTQVLGTDGPESVITIRITSAGTPGDLLHSDKGSALRVKNIRLDATTKIGGDINLGVASELGWIFKDSLSGAPQVQFAVGMRMPTVVKNEITTRGWGWQSSNKNLKKEAEVTFTEGFNQAFRVASTNPSKVYMDHATTATSLLFSISNLPAGVTVTFPPKLINKSCGKDLEFGDSRKIEFTWVSGGPSITGPAGGTVKYTTTYNSDISAAKVTIDTAEQPYDGSKCGNPTVGVKINNPSEFGWTDVTSVFGPSDAATTFPGDDVQPTAVPRYLDNFSDDPLTRLIFGGDWFEVKPIRTVLLYPFVTNLWGWHSAFEIANTGLDVIGTDQVFINDKKPTFGQVGKLKFYMFPNGASPFVIDSTAVPGGFCRGLESDGRLAPGKTLACEMDELLTKSGHTDMIGNMDGYMMVVCESLYCHGASFTFSNSGGEHSAIPALVLGTTVRSPGSSNNGEAEMLDH